MASAGVIGNLNYIPTSDVMGAHENGGRGCAGCHAPHSGGRGSGGVLGSSTVIGYKNPTPNGTAEGDSGLWGTDTTPIETGYAGGQITFDGYVTSIAGLNWGSGAVYTGVVTCLSCHDGNVSKGAMMSGVSYEQAWGLLNFATQQGSNFTAGAVTLYGPNSIPTLLGNDGGTVGDYLNDHPVGPSANVNGLSYPQPLSAYGLTYAVSGTTITWTAAGQYATFTTNYGAPAINGLVVDATNQVPYVLCTTCHNQHQMNVYNAPATGLGAIRGAAGTYATYFFVNSPYNPGSAWTPTAAPSTTQFCRQCHFGVANEAFGANGITTAF